MNCPGCGAEVASIVLRCPRCGRHEADPPLGPPPLPRRTVSTSEFFFPRNSPALWSYYLGLLSIVPLLGFIPGILAVVFGVKGLRLERAQPEARGGAHAWTGLIFGTLSVLGHLAAVALFLGSKKR